MNIVVFVSIWAATVSSADMISTVKGAPLELLKGENTVKAVEIYTPEPGDVPKMEDAPPATIIVQIDMNDADAADALVNSDEF